jgi:hypothetical protein
VRAVEHTTAGSLLDNRRVACMRKVLMCVGPSCLARFHDATSSCCVGRKSMQSTASRGTLTFKTLMGCIPAAVRCMH